MADTVWFVLADVKSELKIATGDVSDDTLLNKYGTAVNRQIDNLIFPFKDTLPATGSAITEDLKEACVMRVSGKYSRHNKNFEGAKAYKEDYDMIIEQVIKRLVATPETRTDRVAVTKAYATEPLQSDPLL